MNKSALLFKDTQTRPLGRIPKESYMPVPLPRDPKVCVDSWQHVVGMCKRHVNVTMVVSDVQTFLPFLDSFTQSYLLDYH